ncbi:MAG: hypothetical protein ABI402_04370 [Ferruginibacter sp.]
MRRIISLLLLVLFFSCNDHSKAPDVSGIKINLSTRRFEKELFTLDTSKIDTKLEQLIAKYPSFGENFIGTILTTDPRWPRDSVNAYVRSFISTYMPVYDTAEKVFADFTPYENEIKNSLQYLQYYFPKYKAPHNIITYIGPMDGYGDAISDDAFIIGLHVHLGKKYSAYQTTWVQETYPGYVTSRFEPSYIVINCMKNVLSDLYPEKKDDRTLIVQMVEKGKRLFLLSKLLPNKEEYKLIGYTETQLKDCYKGESRIWELFTQNNYLQSIDNDVIKNYVDEGPKTQELGEDAPGNIGSFAGWQIVKKFMDKNPKSTLPELMNKDAEIIFQEAKYKP